MATVDDIPVVSPQPIGAREAATVREAGDFFSMGEFQLTVIIFLFGILALAVFVFLLRSGRATPYTMRLFVIIILVFGTLLVVSSSYATEQIAPVVGFFGTIAGYLLGRNDKQRDDDAG
jgi:hypothetical protein